MKKPTEGEEKNTAKSVAFNIQTIDDLKEFLEGKSLAEIWNLSLEEKTHIVDLMTKGKCKKSVKADIFVDIKNLNKGGCRGYCCSGIPFLFCKEQGCRNGIKFNKWQTKKQIEKTLHKNTI